MQLGIRRRRRQRPSLIPLIDVMLVLLFFFMLAGASVQYGRTRIEFSQSSSPSATASVSNTATQWDRFTVVALGNGWVRYQGEARPIDEWADQLTAVSTETEIRLEPDVNVSFQVLLATWESLRQRGIAVRLAGGSP